ncbi:hypothetical protein QAD02_012062 [Eretmocerus hayati]|uniref:Uncharacterized protein n=1 Tax=Eretmocerus hayati TaxID=131215 RepID=A0ACC2NZM5_9HYME|nr:hypothetical protein QAD02_012062 [Eretmocerus hayati]
MLSEEVGNINVETSNVLLKWVLNYDCIVGCNKIGSYVKSSEFTTTMNREDFEWRLFLFPKGEEGGDGNFMSIYLDSYANRRVKVKFFIKILHDNRTVVNFCYFQAFNSDRFGKSHVLKRSLVIDEENQKFINNSITVLCGISHCMNDDIAFDTDHQDFEIKSRLKAFDQLEEAMNDSKFSDVTLVVSGTIFRVHKIILATRSRVFAGMFEDDLKDDTVDNKLIIDGIDPKVFQELLRFMYTGKINENEKVPKLFVAADKYGVEDLRQICENIMCNNISVANAVEYLRFADTHNLPRLKENVLNYVVCNVKKIADDLKNESVTDASSKLILEIIQAFSSHL